jgi:4-hydroxy-tetrahydrodipicolinate synthase
MTSDFKGISTALVTPFKKGEIDFGSLKRLLKQQLDAGINGFVVAGSTGEAATMTLEEKTKVLEFVRSEVSGKVPVIMGAGTNNTKESCELARFFAKKCDALLVVCPYYNKPPQRGLVEHFLKVAEASELPIIMYNVPGRTAVTMDAETAATIASRSPRIIGIKEAAGNLDVIRQLRAKTQDDFLILSGDDATFVGAMGLGAQGVISVISHVVPGWCVNAGARAAQGKDIERLTEEVKQVATVLFCESNPIPVKWALKEMGVIDSAEVRLPLVDLDRKFHQQVREALRGMGAL